jgi:hypothetical protein
MKRFWRSPAAIIAIVSLLIIAGSTAYALFAWVDCPLCGPGQSTGGLSCFGCSGYGSLRLYQSWLLP